MEDGKCWRCHQPVEKKQLSQWFFKITDYAEQLLDDLDKLPGWPDRVKTMQRNWIGRSEGLEFGFEVPSLHKKLNVYTTRPDTIYGVTFVVIPPEHPMVEELLKDNPRKAELEAFCNKVKNTSDIERTSSESENWACTPEWTASILSPGEKSDLDHQLCTGGLRYRRRYGGAHRGPS